MSRNLYEIISKINNLLLYLYDYRNIYQEKTDNSPFPKQIIQF